MTLDGYFEGRRYPGRVIIIGNTREGRSAIAYAIMGRSQASRNRTLVLDDEGTLKTVALDPVQDGQAQLLVYDAVRRQGDRIVVSNGSHTGLIHDTLASGGSLEDALMAMHAEPDEPHFTSRIGGLYDQLDRSCRLAIVRKEGDSETRVVYTYPAEDGYAHCIHTYLETDGQMLPPFTKDPELVKVPSSLDGFADLLWNSLDPQTRVALFVQIGDESRIRSIADGD